MTMTIYKISNLEAEFSNGLNNHELGLSSACDAKFIRVSLFQQR